MVFVYFNPMLLGNVGQYETCDIMVVLNEDIAVLHTQRLHVWVRVEDAVKRLLCVALCLGIAKTVREDGDGAVVEDGKVA